MDLSTLINVTVVYSLIQVWEHQHNIFPNHSQGSSAASTSQGSFLAGFVGGATQFQRLRDQDISSMAVKFSLPKNILK